MMEDSIRTQLFALAEPEYKEFSEKLIPDTPNILGVRIPALQKMARNIRKEDFRAWLEAQDPRYHEEILLRGLVIGIAPMDVDERFLRIAGFIPLIKNWAVCDTFCKSLTFIRTNRARTWDFLQPYFLSEETYAARFAVVTALSFFADQEYAGNALNIFNQVPADEYYIQMGLAWAVAEYYIKVPQVTEPFLYANQLDDFTHNKALQKITESFRVSAEKKVLIRTLKRK